MLRLTWEQVLAWRMRRQLLDPPGDLDAVEVSRRLVGVQAQVASAAALSVAVRQRSPAAGEVAAALEQRRLVKTWAMRGTLHLLPSDLVAACLALLADARTWEKGAWQRAFLSSAQLGAVTTAVVDALDGRVLTREELVAEVERRTGDAALAERLRSGWSSALKPLAWQGLLCQGPAAGSRVTFARPDQWVPGWTGLPPLDEASAVVVPAYLGAHGPATPEAFDAWLLRGATRKATLRGWFTGLGDALEQVEVEGTTAYARAEDVDELAATVPSDAVRLLPAFDQYVLGPGTDDPHVVPAQHRARVSRAAGWISPVVVAAGRVVGTWEAGDGAVDVALFDDGPLPGLEQEVERLGRCLGTELAVRVVQPESRASSSNQPRTARS